MQRFSSATFAKTSASSAFINRLPVLNLIHSGFKKSFDLMGQVAHNSLPLP